MSTLLELLLPVALMLFLVWVRTLVHTEDIPAKSYLDSHSNNPTWFSSGAMNPKEFGDILGPLITKMCEAETPSGLCPEIFSRATWLSRKEYYMGEAIDGLLLLHMALYGQQLGVVGQRSLADFIEGLPGFAIHDGSGATQRSYIRYFDDSKALDQYISNKDYGFSDDTPQLFGIIEVRSVPTEGTSGKLSGDWDVVLHLNATGPGTIDIKGATDVNTKLVPNVNTLSKEVNLDNTRIYWSGGLFQSAGAPAPTGGFVDLQSLVYSWIYNSTGAFSLPMAQDLQEQARCECRAKKSQEMTQDFRQCDPAAVLLQVLTPKWSTEALARIAGTGFQGCLGRFSGLFPVSVREVPFPTPAYKNDPFASIVKAVFGLFFTLLFIWPLSRIMKSVMEDKEWRINEVMKMMGLPAEAITFGWYITYGLLMLLPSALIVLVCWTTVFMHSNKFIVFIFFWLNSLSVVTLCCILAVFFERAKTASVLGALFYFLIYFPYVFVQEATIGSTSKLIASFCPPVALSFGVSIIVELESAGEGVQLSNLGENVENFSMAAVFAVMVIDIVAFMVLAWYLDKIFVVGFGTRQPWNFLCSRRYWRPDACVVGDAEAVQLESQFDDENPGNPRYEPATVDLAQNRSVLLRGLKKFFKTQDGQTLAAVQGLTQNLYENQIFVLLGHNGAGKTTTINMLSGMLPIDEGDALIYGMSAKKDMSSIRKLLGVCPQHDVIWLGMSVKEHLEFFARVKGVAPEHVDDEVTKTIADVGLQEKKDSFAGTLSGGQKRRLSAGIALIGGSRVVFLDEPSSGVDPFSRRELWGCLKAKKTGRTLIMTTHFMDEAEELGDRIAIMAAGQIKCVGTSLFLKSQYGVGYTVTFTKTADALQDGSVKPRRLKQIILEYCSSAKMMTDAGVELVYRMALEESKTFPALFEQLEKRGPELGVAAFCVSVTTLEEVFLRVGQDESEADQTAEDRLEQRSFTRQLSGGENSLTANTAAARPGTTTTSARSAREVVSAGTSASRAMAGEADLEAQATALRAPLTGGSTEDQPHGPSQLLRHVHALMAKRYHNALRDKKAWCCQIVVPLIFLVVALATLKFTGVGSYDATLIGLSSLPGDLELVVAGGDGTDKADIEKLLQGLGSTVVVASDNMTGADFNDYLLDTYYRSDKKQRYGAFRFQHVPKWTASDRQTAQDPKNWQVSDFRSPGQAAPVAGSPESLLFPNGITVPVGTLWNETDVLPLGTTTASVPLQALNNRLQADLFWNASSRDAVPIFFHELHNQLLQATLPAGKYEGSSVKLYNKPFPLTPAQKDLTDTQTSLFLALGFAFIPASYGAFVVLERENKSKHLQIISGVNFVSYWLSTWLWDIVNYMVPAVLSVALIAAFGVESLVNGANFAWTCLVVVMYGFSCTSFTYMLTFLFKSHTSAQNLLLVIYLFTGGLLEIASMILSIVPDTKDLQRNVLVYLFRLMPNYCLADGLTNLITRSNPLVTAAYDCPMSGCPASHLRILGWDLIYMGVGSLVWFLITLILELCLATPKVRALFSFRRPNVVDTRESMDEDVEAERERVLRGDADSEVVVLKGLRKVFASRAGAPPKVAVRDMYFGIPEGQCFGYLGMNGAGKTTTMKILTGEELCTSGEASLGGFDIKTQQNQVRRLIGYCPQFDALIGTLTAREHLELFARIKGVPKESLKSYVDTLLERLTLTPYADRQASTFSGGTKRKLSLGISLVGNPRIVFLDEPTTGVDPESRRFMWTLISATMRGRSVILTTHSMDECEALCSRIGIMVNGSLVCLGSASRLKDRHGSGYQFDVTFSKTADLKVAFKKLALFVKNLFPEGVRVMEGSPGSARVKFRVPKGVRPISDIFRAVEERRAELSLEDYAVSETTLDQIFINFAKHQQDEETGQALGGVIGTSFAESFQQPVAEQPIPESNSNLEMQGGAAGTAAASTE